MQYYKSYTLTFVLFTFLFGSAFAQTPNNISFNFIKKSLTQNDYRFNDSLQSWGYVKAGKGWGRIDSSYYDTFKMEELSVKKLFFQPAPFIAFEFFRLDSKRYVYYVFNIEDVHYYIKEALRTVNKDKVQTNIIVENSNKEFEREVTTLHFEPRKITKGAIITDIYLMQNTAVLVSKIIE